jgi:branched-chain amino acid aminotransferase
MICHNGNFIESELESNRGFLFGDGFFESMRIFENQILLEELHLKRIQRSAALLQLNCDDNFLQQLTTDIKQLCSSTNLNHHARVRVSIYRDGAGLYASSSNEINYLITANQLDSFYQFSENGLSIGIYDEQFKAPGKYSCLKSLSSQLYVMASIYAQQNKFDEVVILNHERNCIEGNTSNLFIIKNNRIYTPPVSDGSVDGVFRNYLIDILQKENYELKIQSISIDDLQHADEIFFCNAVRGIRWVDHLNSKKYNNEITSKIFQLFVTQSQ